MTRARKIPIWLVWTLDVRRTIALRDVCTVQSRAVKIKKILEDADSVESQNVVRCWIEPRQANHFFGHCAIQDLA